jgi:Lysozyme inhibitor LprI
MRLAILIIGLLLLAQGSHAQGKRDLGLGKYNALEELTSHPLDLALDLALVQAMDSVEAATLGDAFLFWEFEAAWDAELNRVYRLLMEHRDERSKEAIRQAQRLWIKLRDAEFVMIPVRYEGLDGTMYMSFQAWERMMFVRHRALELSGYLMQDRMEE